MAFCIKDKFDDAIIRLVDFEEAPLIEFTHVPSISLYIAGVHNPQTKWSYHNHFLDNFDESSRVFKISNGPLNTEDIPDGYNTAFLYQDIFDNEKLLEKIAVMDSLFPDTAVEGTRLIRIQTPYQLEDPSFVEDFGADGLLIDYSRILEFFNLRDVKDIKQFERWFLDRCSRSKFNEMPLGIIGNLTPKATDDINIRMRWLTLTDLISSGIKQESSDSVREWRQGI